MVDQPQPPDRERETNTAELTVIRGVVFNPWVNIPVSILFTLGCGALTAWFASLLVDSLNAPAYEDQGLDIVGTVIGTVVMVLITLAMVAVTIFLIVWWHRVGTDWLKEDQTDDPDGPPTTER